MWITSNNNESASYRLSVNSFHARNYKHSAETRVCSAVLQHAFELVTRKGNCWPRIFCNFEQSVEILGARVAPSGHKPVDHIKQQLKCRTVFLWIPSTLKTINRVPKHVPQHAFELVICQHVRQGSFFPPHRWGGEGFFVSPPPPSEVGGKTFISPPPPSEVGGKCSKFPVQMTSIWPNFRCLRRKIGSQNTFFFACGAKWTLKTCFWFAGQKFQ